MDNKLTLQDFAQLFAQRSQMDNKAATTFVKTVFEIVEEYIAKDKVVKIKGFGTFKLITVSDRESVNVNTGERIVIAGHSKLTFTPDSTLKDAVNRPFGDFVSTEINEGTSLEEMERLPEESLQSLETDESSVDELSTAQQDDVETSAVENNNEEKSIVDSSDVEVQTSEADENIQESENEAPQDKEDTVASAPINSTQENTSYPMSQEPLEPSTCPSSCKHGWLYTLLTVILMAASYFAGYYQLHTLFSFSKETQSDVKAEVTSPAPEVPKQSAPVAKADTVSADTVSQPNIEVQQSVANEPQSAPEVSAQNDPFATNLSASEIIELSKKYPQFTSGEYLIIGDAGRVHLMEVGETLFRIAKKELGDRELVYYIIAYNQFKNPNLIHRGDTIRIPKLVRKPQ